MVRKIHGLNARIADERSIGAARWHGSVGWHSRSLVIKSDQVWSYPVAPRVPGATALIYDNTHFEGSFPFQSIRQRPTSNRETQASTATSIT